MLFLDGVYKMRPESVRRCFQWVREPTFVQLTQLAHTIDGRVGRLLEREGLLERDTEQFDPGNVLDEDDPMPDLVDHSITYRIAVGPHRGARCLRCKLCRPAMRKMKRLAISATWAVFRHTPGWRRKQEPGISMARPAATPGFGSRRPGAACVVTGQRRQNGDALPFDWLR